MIIDKNGVDMSLLFLQSEIEKASNLGFSEGSKGMPPPDATGPDLNETRYYAKAVSLLNGCASKISPKITLLSKKVSEIRNKIETTSAVIESLRSLTSLKSKIESQLEQSMGVMIEAKKNQLLREAELNAFQLTNNLHHPAHYPVDMAQHMSWVVLALAIETIINANFFAGASGLIVGAVIALTFSGVNLTLAFGTGIFFRGRNSVNSSTRLQAWTIFITSWIIIFALNLLTAAYRSASAELLSKMLEENPVAAVLISQQEAFKLALSNVAGVFSGHFPFADLNGLILMFVGLLAAGIGMWKGYSVDDPYPKYGHVTRLSAAANANYAEFEAKLKADASRVSEEPLLQIMDTRQNINSLKQQVNTVKKETADVKNEWSQNFSHLTHEYQSLVDVYRQAIKSVKPNQIPEYFKQPVLLSENSSINESLSELESNVSSSQSEVEVISNTALPFLATIEQSINNEKSTLLGSVITSYLSKVTQLARDGIASRPKKDNFQLI